MNEFLEQFLIECRELAQKATEDLLALEDAPTDRARIDGVFRGFHTLKGAAGIVDFTAMGRLLHDAETVLSAVRSGDRAASPDLIGDCLACLDQVARWLDQIEAEGDLPGSPDQAAADLAARFTRGAPAVSGTGARPERPARSAPSWVDALLSRPEAQGRPVRAALRYEPDSDCFFRGEDPLALIARLHGIVALDVTPKQPWPQLEALDPFDCNLVIVALVLASPEEVAAGLRAALGEVEIWPLAAPGGGDTLSAEVIAVLAEQLLLVGEAEPDGFGGRFGSAARVANAVLRAAGRLDAAAALAGVITANPGDATAFALCLKSLLDPTDPGRLPPSPRGSASTRRVEPHPAPHVGADSAPHVGADDLNRVGADDAPRVGADHAPRAEPHPTLRGDAIRALRVDVDRIDALVALAGELTVAKNAIGHAIQVAGDQADPALAARTLKDRHAVLNRLVSALQRSVLGMRVLPMRHVFQRFPRLVREMSRDLGKPARLDTEGETTEADKATVEALLEPLLHVLRNAMDHGLEPEAERRAVGKAPIARIALRAARIGDQVIVEVSDDGRGIDPARVRRIAQERGIASPAALAGMSDDAALELIFMPGFSTAATITDVSGRGVGMDAVRSSIARLGGQVSIASEIGRGTTVRFVLPFSVMMVRVLTVEAGGQTFGIPIDAVVETVRIPRDRIARLGAAEVVSLRARTLPLLVLSETLALPAAEGAEAAHEAKVVVVTVSGQCAALEVGGFGERMDVMLRPMEGLLAGISGFAGTTLLGDGRVMIVLDLPELLR